MSKETYDRLEQALREHVAAERDGAYLADWVMMTASATESAESMWYFSVFSDSAHHAIRGLADLLLDDVRGDGRRSSE